MHGWPLYLYSHFTSKLGTWLSLLTVNLNYCSHIAVKPMAFDSSAVYLLLHYHIPTIWSSLFTHGRLWYPIHMFTPCPKDLWTLHVFNKHVGKLAFKKNILVSQAPEFFIFRHRYFHAFYHSFPWWYSELSHYLEIVPTPKFKESTVWHSFLTFR